MSEDSTPKNANVTITAADAGTKADDTSNSSMDKAEVASEEVVPSSKEEKKEDVILPPSSEILVKEDEICQSEAKTITIKPLKEEQQQKDPWALPNNEIVAYPPSQQLAEQSSSSISANDKHNKPLDWEGWNNTYNFGLEMQSPWATKLLDKSKTIESRSYDLPPSLLNQKIFIMESQKQEEGKSGLGDIVSLDGDVSNGSDHNIGVNCVGWCTFTSVKQYTKKEDFEQDVDSHLVESESGYGWNAVMERSKNDDDDEECVIYGWVVGDCGRFGSEAASAPKVKRMVRRMRSLFELEIEDNNISLETSTTTQSESPPSPVSNNKSKQQEASVNNSTPGASDLEYQLSTAEENIFSLTQSNSLLSHKLEQLTTKSTSQDSLMVEIQDSLQTQLTANGELRHDHKLLTEKLSSLQSLCDQQNSELLELRTQKQTMEKEQSQSLKTVEVQTKEISSLKSQLEEQQTKEAAMISRLNESKKLESSKSRSAQLYKTEVDELRENYAECSTSLEKVTLERDKLANTLDKLKTKCVERVKTAETNLAKECALNDERKKKMKTFVETKAEELRTYKTHTEQLQSELNDMRQTYRIVREELQSTQEQLIIKEEDVEGFKRQIHQLKSSSRDLSKMGNSLESKLEQTSKETEEHKHKRLAAKHELMTVLRKLEAEQDVSKSLRDSVKFTFIPKALSQQQLLREIVENLEGGLLRLARRLGRTLPPLNNETASAENEDENADDHANNSHTNSPSARRNKVRRKGPKSADWDSTHLLSNLEDESKHVSQGIMTLMTSLDRMHVVLEDQGERTCVSSLVDILTGQHAALTESSTDRRTNNLDRDNNSQDRSPMIAGGDRFSGGTPPRTNNRAYGSLPFHQA